MYRSIFAFLALLFHIYSIYFLHELHMSYRKRDNNNYKKITNIVCITVSDGTHVSETQERKSGLERLNHMPGQ